MRTPVRDARWRHVGSAVARSPMTQPPPWNQTSVGPLGDAPGGSYTWTGMSPPGPRTVATVVGTSGAVVGSAVFIPLNSARASGAVISSIGWPPAAANPSISNWTSGRRGTARMYRGGRQCRLCVELAHDPGRRRGDGVGGPGRRDRARPHLVRMGVAAGDGRCDLPVLRRRPHRQVAPVAPGDVSAAGAA